jgi:hypothetical protein
MRRERDREREGEEPLTPSVGAEPLAPSIGLNFR